VAAQLVSRHQFGDASQRQRIDGYELVDPARLNHERTISGTKTWPLLRAHLRCHDPRRRSHPSLVSGSPVLRRCIALVGPRQAEDC
jgi:hypothetical protein